MPAWYREPDPGAVGYSSELYFESDAATACGIAFPVPGPQTPRATMISAAVAAIRTMQSNASVRTLFTVLLPQED